MAWGWVKIGVEVVGIILKIKFWNRLIVTAWKAPLQLQVLPFTAYRRTETFLPSRVRNAKNFLMKNWQILITINLPHRAFAINILLWLSIFVRSKAKHYQQTEIYPIQTFVPIVRKCLHKPISSRAYMLWQIAVFQYRIKVEVFGLLSSNHRLSIKVLFLTHLHDWWD